MMALSLRLILRKLMALTLIGALAAPILFAASVWIGSSRLIIPKRRALEDRHHELLANPAEYGMDFEFIPVPAADGISLQTILATRSAEPGRATKTRRMEARLVERGLTPLPFDSGTVILLHGRGGRKEDMLSIAQRFMAADFRCIVYDARAHGKSGGNYCTYGVREVEDFRAVLDHYREYLSKKGESIGPVGAFGNSLGASVILQALPETSQIQAAVAVAPFANLPEIVTKSSRKMIHPSLPSFLIQSAMQFGGWRAGFDPSRILPEQAASRSTTPLFLMHGTQDGVIPIAHSHRILLKSKAREKIWHEVPSGYHGNVLAEGGDDGYEAMVLFFLKHLSGVGA